jgi:hypothetical protein
MGFILFKIGTIIIKTTAKPIVSWITHYNKILLKDSTRKEFDIIKKRLYVIGQNYNYYLIKINRRILKVNVKDPIKLLTEEKAIEKGVELVSELFLYSILIGVPLYEIKKGYEDKKKEKLIEEKIIMRINSAVNEAQSENYRIYSRFESIDELIKKVDKLCISEVNIAL